MLPKVAGHDTHMVHDGVAALAAASTFNPDLILLDIGLPRLNGYDVCRAIRAENWGTEIAIVALTGWGQDSDRRQSAAAGFDVHLVKPVDLATLNRLFSELRQPADRPAPADCGNTGDELDRSFVAENV
jgi:CheY-like chemotaxis protein